MPEKEIKITTFTPVEDMTFKQASDELEAIVRMLESIELELEDSLVQYERGVTLLRTLQGRLDTAQQRVSVLMGEVTPESTDGTDTTLS
jgi:exodeoxyribonuclease VII small subunit